MFDERVAGAEQNAFPPQRQRCRETAASAIPPAASTGTGGGRRGAWTSFPKNVCVRLHRRRKAILAIVDTRGQQRPVGLLGRGRDEDLYPGLEIALVARRKGDDHGPSRHYDFLLADLVLQGQRLAVDPGHGLFDVGVGHGTFWLQIPWAISFAG